MTTIAIKNGIIAWDSQTTTEHGLTALEEKIERKVYVDGVMIRAFCGTVSHIARLKNEIDSCRSYQRVFLTDCDECEAIILNTNTNTGIWFSNGCYCYTYSDISTLQTAVGSGYQLALGAMEAGASAIDAVRIAAKHDIYTGGEIQAHSFWVKS